MKIIDIVNNKAFKIVCSFAVVVYVVITLCAQNATISERKRILQRYNEDIAEQKKISKDIAEEKSKVGSDEYIEKLARDKLGMCMADEIIFVDGKEN